jgi:hypothetical protein
MKNLTLSGLFCGGKSQKLILFSAVIFDLGCGLIRPKFVDYRDSSGTQVSTSTPDSLKNCQEGIAAFTQYMAPTLSIKNCSCHATTRPLLTDQIESNRISFLGVKRSADYSFLTGENHPGKEFFKKISQNDYNSWRNLEISKCGLK